MKANDIVGKWTLRSRLGRGGNGEVWRADDAQGAEAAVKILRRRNRIDRFRDEIQFLREHGGIEGVLPLIDSDLPDDPRQAAWYAMPVATPLREALGEDPAPRAVVEALAEIASTLASLHDIGVGHRDVKPDNLFELDGRWVVGDFGLVDHPSKDPRTEHGRRLGPVDYMAPEMREDADAADAGPADVYALAKTIWVTLTSSSLPLPGPHRSDDEAYALVSRLTYERAAELDRLLTAATQHEPTRRPPMRDLAAELTACLSEPPERVGSSTRPELARRVSAMTARGRRAEEEALEFRRTYNAAEQALRDTALSPSYHELGRHLEGFRSTYAGATTAMDELLEPVRAMYAQNGWAGHFFEQGASLPTTVRMATGIRLLSEESPLELCAYLAVDRPHPVAPATIVTLAEVEQVPLGSARQAAVIDRLAAQLAGALDETLRTVAEVLATPPPAIDPDGLAAKVQIRLARLRGVPGEQGNEPRLVMMLNASAPIGALDVQLQSTEASVDLAMRIEALSRGTNRQEWKLPGVVPPGRYRVSISDGAQTISSPIAYTPP